MTKIVSKVFVGLLLVLFLAGCGSENQKTADENDRDYGDNTIPVPYKTKLSEYGLLANTDGQVEYADGVIPYDLSTPLFSDYALKERAIFVPEGSVANYEELAAFEFPEGSILIKNFVFPADFRSPEENRKIIETRILLREDGDWTTLPYVWNEEQTEAELALAGKVIDDMGFIDENGETQSFTYLVPSKNQCQQCHKIGDGEGNTYITPIGPKARYLNHAYTFPDGQTVNQLNKWVNSGILSGAPTNLSTAPEAPVLEDTTNYSVEERARAYLDINCAHCHNPVAPGGEASKLFLNIDNTEEFNLGFCKRPGSAGHGTFGLTYDIVPGNPDESILVKRLETTDPAAMMPILGRALSHDEGVQLIRDWISSLPAENCDN